MLVFTLQLLSHYNTEPISNIASSLISASMGGTNSHQQTISIEYYNLSKPICFKSYQSSSCSSQETHSSYHGSYPHRTNRSCLEITYKTPRCEKAGIQNTQLERDTNSYQGGLAHCYTTQIDWWAHKSHKRKYLHDMQWGCKKWNNKWRLILLREKRQMHLWWNGKEYHQRWNTS
jgi:hypothetical protein